MQCKREIMGVTCLTKSLSEVSIMDGRSFTEDRISDLPNDLLAKILSLLPAEEAVHTCILSKRWKRVWACVHVLAFDDHKHLIHDLTKEDFLKREAKFEAFVYGVLCHRENLSLDTFKLTLCGIFSYSHPHISEILSKAALCMPRVVSICICLYELFGLFGSIFTCASAEEMLLAISDYYSDTYIRAEYVNLPRLKRVELDNVDIDDDFIKVFLSGCPVLEELVFSNCWFDIGEISSTVLKKLTIKECYQYREMRISCPSVVSLGISCNILGITLKNMPSIITADLLFEDATYTNDEIRDLKLLNSLSNVASLRLFMISPDIMDFLAEDISNCPTFKNLRSLELGELDIDNDWNMVICLLQHSPNLKTLTLHFCQPSEDATEEEEEEELVGDAPFQLEYLETLKIVIKERNDELAEEVVRIMGVLIKTIGKVVVL